jgi:diaminopimelate decarboxylase
MPALAWRLRAPRGGRSGRAVRSLPVLLLKDAAGVLRDDGVATPRRLLLPNHTASIFRETVALLGQMRRASSPDLAIAYSIKTNPSSELLGLVQEYGLWAEAITQDEVSHAIRSGIACHHIVLNGPAKWWPTPNTVSGYGAVFCDSVQELRGAHKRVLSHRLTADCLGVRLRPATVRSRFGIGLDDPGVFREVVKTLKNLPRDQGIGFHFHIASSLVGLRTWRYLAQNFLAAVELLAEHVGARPIVLSFGGGWHPDDWTPFLREDFRHLLAQCRHGMPMVRRIILEPGKALSQGSMCLLTRVLEVRRFHGQTEIVVDGSIAELPDLRSHPHRIASLNSSGKLSIWGPGSDRVLGRLCMEFDVLSDAVQIPRSIHEGDLVAYLDAGAYDASMSYSFGRGAPPPGPA